MLNNIDVQKIADELDFDFSDVEMLLEVFIQTAEETLISLNKAIVENDFENIFMLSHSIKGSASNLLLEDIVELAKILEFESNEKNKINYNEVFIKLSNELKKLKKNEIL